MNINFEMVLPANGWEAIFDDGKSTRIPLIGWGFNPQRDGVEGKIVGLIPGSHLALVECEEMKEFLCYIPCGISYP